MTNEGRNADLGAIGYESLLDLATVTKVLGIIDRMVANAGVADVVHPERCWSGELDLPETLVSAIDQRFEDIKKQIPEPHPIAHGRLRQIQTCMKAQE